jgi:uncharacterized phage protein gp47/JayE
MPGLSSVGFEPKAQETIEADVAAALRTNVSPTLNLSATSSLGQYNGASSAQLAQLWEAIQAVYAARDPYQATGDALAQLTRLVGVERLAATKSTVLANVTLAAGTYVAGALVVHVAGDATARFVNRSTVVAPGGVASGVVFDAETAGVVRANAGTLTVIANPVAGFTAITNPLDATLGTATESDAALRQRWSQQLARRGSATVDAIRADVLQVTGVTFVRVYENDTDATVESIPPHAFEALVLGGDDQAVADAIFATKPAGIQASGTTTATVTDSQGAGHTIKFSRPTDVNLYLSVTVSYLSGQFVGSAALKQTLADWGDDNLGPGNDAIHARLLGIIMSQPGVVDASLAIGNAPSPVTQANYAIGNRQIARLDTSRITVTATAVVGVP